MMQLLRTTKPLTENEVLQRLSMFSWRFIHKRMRSPFYTSLLFEAASKHYLQQFPFPYEADNILYLDTVIAIADDDWQLLRQRIWNTLNKDPRFLLRVLRQSYSINKRIEAWCRIINKTTFNPGDTKALLRHWDWYLQHTFAFGASLILPIYVEQDMEEQLQAILRRQLKKPEAERAFQILTTVQRAGTIQEEERALLRLAQRYGNSRSLPDTVVDRYLQSYSWIVNTSFDGTFLTKQQLQQRVYRSARLRPALRLAALEKKEQTVRREFRALRNALRTIPKTLNLIDTLQESIYFRNWRTERYYRNAYFLRNLFAATAKALGLSRTDDIFLFVPDEIVAGLHNGAVPARAVLRERKKGYMILADSGHEFIASGKFLAKARHAFEKHTQDKAKEIRGNVAFPGIVQGPVRVVLHKNDLHKVRKGDILVAGSTTPDYVPVLRHVRGIITEEGGVLSHASVISRELHISCIIGTKNATKVLKDGDIVEVDAEKGTVRRIG